jgi:hypothetical protein
LLTKEQRKGMNASPDVPKVLQAYIASMKGNKLQLLEFEWIFLPVERIKITIITDRNTGEFTYNF